MLKSIVLFGFVAFMGASSFAKDKSLTLNIKFDKPQTISAGEGRVKLTGPFVKEKDGSTGLAYGSKELPRIPADKIMGKKGTIIFTFMVKPRKQENSLKTRMLLVVRGKGRERIFFYQCGSRELVFFTFKKYISPHAVKSLKPVKFNKWYQAACTWDGSTVKFFIDGILQAEFKQPYIPQFPKRSTFIHFGPYIDRCTNPKPWGEDSCSVRDLKVYNRALSLKEIMLAAGLKAVDKTKDIKSFLTVPKVKKGPVVDGTLKDPAWQRAASFITLIDGGKPSESLSYKMNSPKFCHDGKNIYIGFQSVFPGNYNLIKGNTRKDKEPQVWGNESFELHFDIGKNAFRFAGNAAGGYCEMLNMDSSYTGAWQYKKSIAVRIDDSRLWQGEIAVPFQTIGVKSGDKIKINFCRTWRGLQRTGVTSLAGTTSYATKSAYATVQLSNTGTAFQQDSINNPNFGNLTQKIQLISGKNSKVEYRAALMSSDGLPEKLMWNNGIDVPAGKVKQVSNSKAIETTSYDRILFKAVVKGSKKILMQQVVPFKILENYLDVIPAYSTSKVYMKPRYGMIKGKAGNSPIQLTVISPSGKIIYKTILKSKKEFATPFARNNKPGIYKAEVSALIKGRKKVFASKSFRYHGIGPWEKEKTDERILAPFTPLTVKQQGNNIDIGMWGRLYQYTDSILPTTITALKKTVASSANLYVNGTAVKCQLKVTKSSPSRIELAGATTAQKYDLKQKSWIEYDGFLWNDINFKAKENLANLKLVIDIPSKFAKFYHATAAGFGAGGGRTGDVDKNIDLPFFPFVWVGGYEQGLSWFAESKAAWKTKKKFPVRLIKRGNVTALEITFADKLKKGQNINLKFGLIATPVKPFPKKYPMTVFGDGFATHLNKRSSRHPLIDVTYAQALSGPTFNDLPPVFDMKKLADCVKKGKENNAVTIPYQAAIFVAGIYPEVKDNLLEWQTIPECHLSYKYKGKPMWWYNICPASEAGNYYVYRVKELIDKAKLGGLYFDFGPAYRCGNKYHGCDGSYPIRAKRQFYKQIAQALADKNNGKYKIVVHNSESVQIPTFTFVTNFFNGEGLRQMSSSVFHDGKDLLDHYTITDFASEHSSLPWGVTSSIYVPADPLLDRFGGKKEGGYNTPQEKYRFRMTKAAMAGALIHNTIPSSSRMHFGWFDKVIRFYDDFKVDQSEFLPYWRNKEYVKVLKGKDVYVSLYRRPDKKEILAVIAHVSKEHLDQDVEIEFYPAKLGFKELVSANELLTGPDPKYKELYTKVPDTKRYSPIARWRIPVILGDFGVKFQGLKGNKIKLNLKHHSVAIVKIIGK
jgi:Concanavalin A-like lectin/glucanases superfamily/Glycoside hydrolase 123, N-terminal domain